jgi:hypothetical protein
MSDKYRAKADDWAEQEKWKPDDTDARCLLELRSRVEWLEATQHAHLDASQLSEADREAMTEPGRVVAGQAAPSVKESLTAGLTGSLVERIEARAGGDGRAAIREIAAWLRVESKGHLGSGAHWAHRMEQEASQ